MAAATPRKNIIILGAAGRDFHNFNMVFRGDSTVNVVAFTATQIPDIDDKMYPPALAGADLYPQGIPIRPESELEKLIAENNVDEAVFAYSDVTHEHVMHTASRCLAAGASFRMLGPRETMAKSSKPVVAVVASRTGAGKSQTSRRVVDILQAQGHKVVSVRHPMPYGDLEKQAVQRFADVSDLAKHECTIEECEEYEPHLVNGNVIYAGVDYEAILRQAEQEADVVVWDGGNNDFAFYKPDLTIVVLDPHRAGDELKYHPGEVNLRLADVVVINKMDSADAAAIQVVRDSIKRVNPTATVIDAASPVFLDTKDGQALLAGKRCLAVEDGPTTTHGCMRSGAGTLAVAKFGGSLVDPRPFLKGTLVDTFAKYPDIGCLLPAMGYGERQSRDLQETINASDAEVVVIATPIDLRRVCDIQQPCVRVRYELQEIGAPKLDDVLARFAPSQ